MVNLDQVLRTVVANSGNRTDQLSVEFTPGTEHVSLQTDLWTLSAFKEKDITFRPQYIIDEIEKYENELLNDLYNKKNTTVRPIYYNNAYNIITSIGLTQSAKRDTGEVATTNTHNSIGTSSTTATEADVSLAAEDTGGSYARRSYASSGQRKVTGSTAKYGMLWTDSAVSAVPISIKESGVHWASTGASTLHARVTFTTFSMSSGDLFVTQINELHQNA
ncbi:MAG: hypothetical protein ACKO7N_05390 [Candidatus Nitrosotenuis sp.]